MEFDNLMKMVNEVQTVCHELNVMELKYTIQNDSIEQEKCRQLVQEFNRLTIEKLEDISYHICSNSDSFKIEHDPNAQKEDIKKTANTKNDMVCYSKPDVKLGFLVSFEDRNQPRSWIEFQEDQIRSGVPMALKTASYIMRAFWTSFDYLTQQKYSKDMMLGGVLNITCFDMPQVPVTIKGWKIKNLIDREQALSESTYLRSD